MHKHDFIEVSDNCSDIFFPSQKVTEFETNLVIGWLSDLPDGCFWDDHKLCSGHPDKFDSVGYDPTYYATIRDLLFSGF